MPILATTQTRGPGRPRFPDEPHAPCGHCGGPVTRREGEALADYRKRLTCSRDCARRMGRSGRPVVIERWEAAKAAHNPCPQCGTAVEPRKSESITKYVGRATCGNPACVVAYRNRNDADRTRARLAEQVARIVEPLAEVDFGNGFAAHNLRLRDGGFGRVVAPDSRTLGGVASAWMAS